jgi:hypothetical protein
VALQWPKCTQCSAQHQQQAQQCVQGTYCGGWRRCACLDAKTRVLAVGALASTTCLADLLFLSGVPHPLLGAPPPPCVHPYLGFGGIGPGPKPEADADGLAPWALDLRWVSGLNQGRKEQQTIRGSGFGTTNNKAKRQAKGARHKATHARRRRPALYLQPIALCAKC